MTYTTLDIDDIVSEVLKRLDTHSAPVAERETHDVLKISQGVVALIDIEGKIDGVSEVTVPRRSVVTPAVRDFLNERNVALTFSTCEPDSTAHTQRRILVGVTCDDRDAKDLSAASFDDDVDYQQVEKASLVDVVDALADHVRHDTNQGLMLTVETAAAVCLANRSTHVRASLGSSAADVACACRAVATNLLIVDPRKIHSSQLRQLLRAFVTPSAESCAAKYRKRLGLQADNTS